MSYPSVLIAIPTWGRPSIQWFRHFNQIQKSLATSLYEAWDERPVDIAEKRNNLIKQAIAVNAQTIFFIGDDVHVPAHALELMLERHRLGAKAITGVYWTKTAHPQPYIYRGYLDGAFYDWKAGDYIEVDWAGCDCLMLDVAMLKSIPEPWFSLKYDMSMAPPAKNIETAKAPSNTEDLYFYAKLKDAGVKLMCDTAIQCFHEERGTGLLYGLVDGMPQKDRAHIPTVQGKRIADIGCGKSINPLYQYNTIIRFDADEACKPDFVCDARMIPAETESFDMAQATHVLEHLTLNDTVATLQEWGRILKIGGELIVRVPDLSYAAVVLVSDGPYRKDARWQHPYELLMVYGSQDGPEMFHRAGFTKNILEDYAIRAFGDRFGIEVKSTNAYPGGENDELTLRAVKLRGEEPLKRVAESYLPALKLSPRPVAQKPEPKKTAKPKPKKKRR